MLKTLYQLDGVVRMAKFFDAATISECNRIIDEMQAKFEQERARGVENPNVFFDQTKVKQIQYLHKLDPLFQTVVERLRPLAITLSGEKDLYVLNVQLFEKHPKISKPTRWHQDQAYFKVKPANAITFWISLDVIGPTNGPISYILGSHKHSNLLHDRYSKDTTFRVRSGVPGLSLCVHDPQKELGDTIKEVPFYTEPGDVLAHHCLTLHQADKNRSEHLRRRAIGVVFIPSCCEVDPILMAHHQKMLAEDLQIQALRARL